MKLLKSIIIDLLPPVITRILRNVNTQDIKFKGPFSAWNDADSRCTGYDSQEILDKVLEATQRVIRGEAEFERDSVIFYKAENNWPITTGLMTAAALNEGKLSVLDFGGSLGSSYFQNRRFLHLLKKISWNVIEQEHYVKAGKMYIQDDVLKFYESMDDCLKNNTPNVLLLSSVLQYIEHPYELITSTMSSGADFILLDRTIVNKSDSDRIYLQNVPKTIYRASYPCRSLSEKKLIGAFDREYELITDFASLEFNALKYIDSEFKGYLFLRRNI